MSSESEITWDADKVRSTFIDYFKSKDHTFWPSSSVVPYDDPTLLFTNAGMNQYKPLFLGQVDPNSPMAPLKRAVNSQKCIRAGGKHNDLEDVGKDVYHHTYFEMLGNWSFGDYFKEEAIFWAWDLLTRVYGLEEDRLYASYFCGDEKDGVPADLESRDIWLKYLPAERILPFDKHDNFWEMGDIGPCGPCIEIHYDKIGGRDAAHLVNAEPGDPNVIEIWNNVFMQFNRGIDGSLTRLPNVHVDTGMGFERLVAILQNKTSNYDTDVFAPILSKIQEVSGARPYSGLVGAEDTDHVDMAYRVLADHIRTLTFSITDGAVPGPNGRGYVLRRVLRRAVRYGQQILGAPEGFFHTMVPTVVNHFKTAFPELEGRQEYVMRVIHEEEESFNRTLKAGIKRFNKEVKIILEAGKTVFPGEMAFFLYGTMGFPVDLTELMAEEQGLSLDKNRFEEVLEEDREMARMANKTNYAGRELILEAGPIAELKENNITPTDDEAKYTWHKVIKASVKAIYTPSGFVETAEAGETSIGFILDQTNFYAVSGGQVTDLGKISNSSGGIFSVTNVQSFAGFVEHMGTITYGSVSVGDEVTLSVDYEHRGLVAPNHTMTHVLNYSLRKFLGEHVDQKGSLVDHEKLRFDFNNEGQVSTEVLKKVEDEVNSQINDALPVHYKTVPLASARAINSLRCVFGDTYPDPVRVVAVGKDIDVLVSDPENEAWNAYSVELCAGTHISNTANAKKFKIVSEGSIAKGIRRVVCFTGIAAVECEVTANAIEAQISIAKSITDHTNLSSTINEIRASINLKPMSIVVKNQLLDDLKTLEKKMISLRNEAKAAQIHAAVVQAEALYVEGAKCIASKLDCGTNASALSKAAEALISKGIPSVLLIGTDITAGTCSIVAALGKAESKKFKAGNWLKECVLPIVGGKGGGKPTLAQGQGTDLDRVMEALDEGKNYAEERL